jgi:glutathione S-transferase
MVTLHHHPLCPHSRFARLCLGEYGLAHALVDERPWERDEALLTLNPAGQVPVLVEAALAVPGAMPIAEYLHETRGMAAQGARLMPSDPAARVEVRRLCDWFHHKFHSEVSEGIVREKVFKRYMRIDSGGGPPEMAAVRGARSNLRVHLAYLDWLLERQVWLAGDTLSYADLAAAAHFSAIDYLGDVPWTESAAVRDWYGRIKSRPSFRALLADRLAGMAPASHYAEVDF